VFGDADPAATFIYDPRISGGARRPQWYVTSTLNNSFVYGGTNPNTTPAERAAGYYHGPWGGIRRPSSTIQGPYNLLVDAQPGRLNVFRKVTE